MCLMREPSSRVVESGRGPFTVRSAGMWWPASATTRVSKVTERIAELMYTVLLRELDYAEDFDIAELEIELEAEGKLDQFTAACKKLHKLDWRMVRSPA